jgi:hypothetical protein
MGAPDVRVERGKLPCSGVSSVSIHPAVILLMKCKEAP